MCVTVDLYASLWPAVGERSRGRFGRGRYVCAGCVSLCVSLRGICVSVDRLFSLCLCGQRQCVLTVCVSVLAPLCPVCVRLCRPCYCVRVALCPRVSDPDCVFEGPIRTRVQLCVSWPRCCYLPWARPSVRGSPWAGARRSAGEGKEGELRGSSSPPPYLLSPGIEPYLESRFDICFQI